MNTIDFAIIGAGWRTEFFLRICEAMPERFRTTMVLARDPAKGQALTEKWGVPTTTDLDELARTNPEFVVVSVPWGPNPGFLTELAKRGIPALSETPPAPDIDGLIALNALTKNGAKIQVAEQYQFQPLNTALIALAQSGKLGAVTQAQVAVAHGYHGISLLRALLDVGFENAAIRGIAFQSPIVTGPGRDGPPPSESLSRSNQVVVTLEFDGKLGIFDFTGDQYFSWIRSRRVLVRGDRGEINNTDVRYLQDFQTPIHTTLTRVDAGQDGNLEGYYHKGITCGDSWIYKNPFAPARLADDEIAIATCLQKMSEYAVGGPDFCSLAEASQDHYLSLMMDRAVASREEIVTMAQPWALP